MRTAGQCRWVVFSRAVLLGALLQGGKSISTDPNGGRLCAHWPAASEGKGQGLFLSGWDRVNGSIPEVTGHLPYLRSSHILNNTALGVCVCLLHRASCSRWKQPWPSTPCLPTPAHRIRTQQQRWVGHAAGEGRSCKRLSLVWSGSGPMCATEDIACSCGLLRCVGCS